MRCHLIFGVSYMLLRHHRRTRQFLWAAPWWPPASALQLACWATMNLLHTVSARIILGPPLFDDVLGMIVAGVVVGLVSSTGLEWHSFLITAIEAIGFCPDHDVFYAPRVVKRMEPGMKRMSTQDAPLIIALAICLGLSYAAVKIGMAATSAHFFAGLHLPNTRRDGTCGRACFYHQTNF